ncbi:MAG TPA: BrnA antitoxin family protein [Spirochaetota bacterium]|nr:BrnA antitoxin family protein [Spirochaetota bacterium]HQP49083.1 BrnA antitoxin family protein [Spirochaetota bacterium]
MRKEYNFSDSVKNPYSQKLKKQITIRINEDTIEYFKSLAIETGIPYQKLMDLYLADCAKSRKKLKLSWK